MRILGAILIAIGLIALAADFATADLAGFRLRSIGEYWFDLHRDSRLLIQPAIERHIHQDLYFSVVEPVLRQPAAVVSVVLGSVLMLISALRRRAA
ncbi:MAG: hypothetical protein KTR21_10675 [Rhodobacteraceae bacterium]|nr:hypothetical protein [Paracoccaceae bacterium]